MRLSFQVRRFLASIAAPASSIWPMVAVCSPMICSPFLRRSLPVVLLFLQQSFALPNARRSALLFRVLPPVVLPVPSLLFQYCLAPLKLFNQSLCSSTARSCSSASRCQLLRPLLIVSLISPSSSLIRLHIGEDLRIIRFKLLMARSSQIGSHGLLFEGDKVILDAVLQVGPEFFPCLGWLAGG